MPLTMTPSPVQPLQAMVPEPSPATPVVQTLDKDDDEDIAEDQPMPAQPLLPARRPRADSIADPGVVVEAPADVVPVAPPAEVPVQAGLPVPAVQAPVEDAVAPASKKARQYDLPPQQPLQPMPQLQPELPTSSSSPAALDDSTLPEPEAKKHKKQEEDDEELPMDTSCPLQPTDPPLLPLSEHQTPVAADLEASRSRSRTHSEVSEAPTIPYQDPPHDPPRQIGQEEASLPEPPSAPPDPPSRTSSVAPTEFYSDIAKAHGRVHARLGDEQDFLFWQNMGKHNLVLWLDYTEEATTYHTLDMSMWGAVRYRRTFSYDDCNMVQSVAIDHKYSPLQRIIKQGATVMVHQDLCIEDLHEALIPKGNDGDALVGADLTEYRSVLGKLNWLQSRTQFHISYHFSRCASAAANATILDAKELNKVVRMVKDKPQRLLYAPIKGTPRLMGFPDAAYKNNADGSSQRGQCIFICQPRNKERDTKGSLIDYESHKIKRTVLSTTVAELYAFMKCYGSAQFYRGLWMDMTAQPIEVHLRTDANNLVTTAASTRLPEQKETIHMIQMLRQEACSGQMHDLAHVLTQYCPC